jgi:hypothetical protein
VGLTEIAWSSGCPVRSALPILVACTEKRHNMATEPRQQLSDMNAGSRNRALLLSGLPVTERRLQVAGVSTAVLEGGAGPPILLIENCADVPS